MPSRTGSRERARLLISFAMRAGEARGMRYTSAKNRSEIPVRGHTVQYEQNLPSHCRLFHGHPSLCMCTNCMRCFSTRAFATDERREIRLNTLFHNSLIALGLTSVTIHPFPSSKHPRRPADSTHQPVLSIVHPSTLGCGERIDRRRFISIRVELVRPKAFEQALCGRRAVFVRRGGARDEWRR